MLPLSRRGTVYGTLLNHRAALEALGDAVHAAPYKAPPRAPVLYIKPRNTWIAPGDAIVVPADVDEVEIGATLGLVIGRPACRVDERDALAHVAGYVIVDDVSVPHASYYRPSLRCKVRDTFCPIGPFVPRERVADPDALAVSIEIDGACLQRTTTGDRLRGAARLLADVSAFMTLVPGDVLSIGVAAGAPRARAGQAVGIEIEGLGRLDNPLVAEESRS
ncbi:MAG: fumarylacetoacetate hydrolase family protein [Proteobacteria bacterium]|nr:fumarylacetoacetate hydrolase family protein [Pseudomonadota bacterium]